MTNKARTIIFVGMWVLFSCSALPPLERQQPVQAPRIGCTPSPTATPAPSPTVKSYTCLIVTADESLHLRQLPTEHSPAITWLPAGSQLSGLLQDGDWWFVNAGGKYGYVYSDYVEACKQ